MSQSEDKCPNLPITVRCSVRKPVDNSTHFLAWQCDDAGTNERVIFCNDDLNFELDCAFGKLYIIRSACICDGRVIDSEATFNTTSLCDMVLYCSDGEDKARVSVSIKGKV